jgi:hypothetical protein
VHLAAQDGNAWIRANLYGGQLRFYHQTRRTDGGMNDATSSAGENDGASLDARKLPHVCGHGARHGGALVNGSKLRRPENAERTGCAASAKRCNFTSVATASSCALECLDRAVEWRGTDGRHGGSDTVSPMAMSLLANLGISARAAFISRAKLVLLEVPAERIAAVRFRGEPSRSRTAGRIRLHDGRCSMSRAFGGTEANSPRAG